MTGMHAVSCGSGRVGPYGPHGEFGSARIKREALSPPQGWGLGALGKAMKALPKGCPHPQP